MSSSQAASFFLPAPREMLARVRLALFFSIFFYVFYGSGAWLADVMPWRLTIGFEPELVVPFLPHTAWIYLSLSAFMLLPMFAIRQPEDFILAIKVLCGQVVFASLLFVLLPAETIYPPRDAQGDLPLVFRIADWINLSNNELPSLHVCFAVTTAGLLAPFARGVQKVLIGLWLLAIVVSTMTIHEHHLASILAGGVLGLAGVEIWQRRASFAPATKA